MTPTRTPAAPHKRIQRANRPPVASEHIEQAALMTWAELESGRIPELALLFAIPNGGARHIATARKLKAEGVKPGVPDLFLPVARKCTHGLFIEMKSRAKTARTSDEQVRWFNSLCKQGYLSVVAYGWDEARDTILRYLEGKL